MSNTSHEAVSAPMSQETSIHTAAINSDEEKQTNIFEQNDEERSQLHEALDTVLSEPDPVTRRTLMKWLQPVIEKHPEVQYRLKGLQDEDAGSEF